MYNPYGKGGAGGGKKGSQPAALGNYRRKWVTAAGRPICFAYNNMHERCWGQCGREHVCWWCEEKHAGHTCPMLRAFMATGAVPQMMALPGPTGGGPAAAAADGAIVVLGGASGGKG